jgi:hypothetical protein
MTQTDFGPVNIIQGNAAIFTVEFFDTLGNTIVPSSAVLSITYTNTGHTSQTDTVPLNPNGYFFNGTWSSSLAAYGIANWMVTSSGSTAVAQTGLIRVTDA